MKTEEYKELDVLMSSEVINTKGEDNKFKLPSPLQGKCTGTLYQRTYHPISPRKTSCHLYYQPQQFDRGYRVRKDVSRGYRDQI